MADQRGPDKRVVITHEQELAIGARGGQLLGARHEMAQRALASCNRNRTAEEQRFFSERD